MGLSELNTSGLIKILVKKPILTIDTVKGGCSREVFTTPTKTRNIGMIVCPYCGVINSDSVITCKNCNQNLIKSENKHEQQQVRDDRHGSPHLQSKRNRSKPDNHDNRNKVR